MAKEKIEKRPRHPMPPDIKEALREKGLAEAYRERPPYQRNDYLGWIAAAKREATRLKRVSQMLEELRGGSVYMGMAWKSAGTAKRAVGEDGSARVQAYIESFSGDARRALVEMRDIIRSAAKGAEERMSYGMPSYHSGGPVAYFAAAKAHIGFYPTASGIAAFADDLGGYESSKGAVRFPLGKKLPAALIRQIVKYRMQELKAKAGATLKRTGSRSSKANP